ncbi:MAG: class I SAM-dependent methyltransferase [Candidatus Omnitrophota bacterium]
MVEHDFYNRYWTGKLPKMLLFGEAPKWEEKEVKRYLDLTDKWLSPNDRIMDYGCGEGHFISRLKSKYVWGVDVSEKAVERAEKLYPNLAFSTTDIFLPLKFDVITSFDVFEHIFDFDEVFKYINAHLKPGGKLIIATNEMCFLKMAAIGLFYMDTFFYPYSPHIRFFTRKTLQELLESKGYKVIHYDRIHNHFGFLSSGQFVVAERYEVLH